MSQASYSLTSNPLHEQYINRQLQDDFEASMDFTLGSDSINMAEQININGDTHEIGVIKSKDEPIQDEPLPNNEHLLKYVVDFEILLPPVPKSIMREYQEQEARRKRENQENRKSKDEKKAKKREKKESRKREKRKSIGKHYARKHYLLKNFS